MVLEKRGLKRTLIGLTRSATMAHSHDCDDEVGTAHVSGA